MIMDDRAPSSEHTVAVVQNQGDGEPPELFLTIENTIEDRVRAYSRLVRMKQILKKSPGTKERS